MLYDQASLLSLCAEVYDEQPELCSYAIKKSVHWLETRMKLPSGLYGSATDADTSDGEGHYYTFKQPKNGIEAELFRLTECGIHEGRYLPWMDLKVLADRPDESRQVIEERKNERNSLAKPELDTKAVISWNAYLAYALVRCARATRDDKIGITADNLFKKLTGVASQELPHAVYENGEHRGYQYLEDYSSYLLLLSEQTRNGEIPASDVEETLQAVADRFEYQGALWHTSERSFESQSLWQDTPFPSGGSMLLRALAEMDMADHRLGNLAFTNIAEVATNHPVFFAFWCAAFDKVFTNQI